MVVEAGEAGRGTSDTLKKQVGGERLEIVVENQHMAATREIVAKVSGGAINVDEGLRQISAPVTTGSKALIEAAKLLEAAGNKVFVVKAQIHAGGRGKGGGVKLAKNLDEVNEKASQIIGMQLITMLLLICPTLFFGRYIDNYRCCVIGI